MSKDFNAQVTQSMFNKEISEYISQIEIPEYYHDTLIIENKISKILYGIKTIEINRDKLIDSNSTVKNIYYLYAKSTHITISYYINKYNTINILIIVTDNL
jgi:hypothetical protein